MKLLLYFVRTQPERLKRFCWFIFVHENRKRPLWLLEWAFLFLDLVALPEFLQLLHRLLVWDQQKLTSEEKDIAYPIFQDTLEWDLIRMNRLSMISQKFKFAFVSFHTIHFGDRIPTDIFIHELVHIWQYQKYGSAYIIRSLHAQHTKEGYNYGGRAELQARQYLQDFNFEQMAEVIRDGYLDRGRSPIYNKYIKQLFE